MKNYSIFVMHQIIREMWNTKGILFNFAISDIKIRYKSSALGIVWSIIEPLLMLGVLFFVFSTIFKFEIPNFPIYLLLGLITWNFFKNSTNFALYSMVNRTPLLTQIYFPRSIPAISSCLSSSLMLIIELGILGIFMIILGYTPPITILLLPLVFLLLFLLVLGISLPISVLNVKYRDIEFIWGIVIHAGFFLTPIFYQFDMLPEYLQNILQFLPTVQILTMAQHLTLYGEIPSINSILYSVFITLVILGVGYVIFRKLQARIVEEL